MKPFDTNFTRIESFIDKKREPDFNNILSVLQREKPSRPTLFEYYLHDELYASLTKNIQYDDHDPLLYCKRVIDGYRIAGYDYATLQGSDFYFKTGEKWIEGSKSKSMNEGIVITDRKSFENYNWPDPDSYDYSRLEILSQYLPDGMKIVLADCYGVLEVVVELIGYDNLCFMMADDPKLVEDIFKQVGSRLVRYHEICAEYDSVGAHIFGDDWGFNSQTFMSPGDLRRFVIPWHKKAVEKVHTFGKPAILHSCGKLDAVMDDIIDDIGYDAKHSYEDNILKVENAYDKYGDRIAILGGLDVDFLCRSLPEDIYNRAVAMIDRTGLYGGYALGSGNSIPNYVPQQNYLAMIAAAVFNEPSDNMINSCIEV